MHAAPEVGLSICIEDAECVKTRITDPPALKPRRVFRLVTSHALRDTFASDRQHMRDERGEWTAPPPSWPCIAPAGGAEPHTLPLFLDADVHMGEGTCVLEDADLAWLPDIFGQVALTDAPKRRAQEAAPLEQRRTIEIVVL